MSAIAKITFVSAVNDRKIFADNLLISPIFSSPHPHQIIAQVGFSSAARAYNDAIEQSENEIIVFCHQDMIFPNDWISNLGRSLQYLHSTDPNWGVLGCFGKTTDGADRGHVYMPGLGMLGTPLDHPEAVRTLDEIVLILRKSSGLRFDLALPHYHFYGADICLQAASLGMTSYALAGFCIHNCQYNLVLPPEFYACYRHLKRRWKQELPIYTTCVRITALDLDVNRRRLREFYRSLKGTTVGAVRWQSGRQLLDEIEVKNRPKSELAKCGDKQLCS